MGHPQRTGYRRGDGRVDRGRSRALGRFVALRPGSGSSFRSGAAAQGLSGFLAVDHRRRAELIDEHAKAGGPKGLLNRHLHRPFFRERIEYAFGLSRVVDAERDHDALHRFVAVGWGSKGALNRRQYKASELALDEPGKGNRTAI